jgi:hypothetical protein
VFESVRIISALKKLFSPVKELIGFQLLGRTQGSTLVTKFNLPLFIDFFKDGIKTVGDIPPWVASLEFAVISVIADMISHSCFFAVGMFKFNSSYGLNPFHSLQHRAGIGASPSKIKDFPSARVS